MSSAVRTLPRPKPKAVAPVHGRTTAAHSSLGVAGPGTGIRSGLLDIAHPVLSPGVVATAPVAVRAGHQPIAVKPAPTKPGSSAAQRKRLASALSTINREIPGASGSQLKSLQSRFTKYSAELTKYGGKPPKEAKGRTVASTPAKKAAAKKPTSSSVTPPDQGGSVSGGGAPTTGPDYGSTTSGGSSLLSSAKRLALTVGALLLLLWAWRKGYITKAIKGGSRELGRLGK